MAKARCWPFQWSMITKMARLSVAQGPCSAVLPTVNGCHYAFQKFPFFCVTLYITNTLIVWWAIELSSTTRQNLSSSMLVNWVYNYHRHNYFWFVINVNYVATCFYQISVIFRPVHDVKIRLHLEVHFMVTSRTLSFV